MDRLAEIDDKPLRESYKDNMEMFKAKCNDISKKLHHYDTVKEQQFISNFRQIKKPNMS